MRKVLTSGSIVDTQPADAPDTRCRGGGDARRHADCPLDLLGRRTAPVDLRQDGRSPLPRLVWPDGRNSIGGVTKSPDGYQFLIDGESSIAREGKRLNGKICSDIRALPAIQAGNNRFIVDLPRASSMEIDPVQGDNQVFAKAFGKEISRSSPNTPKLFLNEVEYRRVRFRTFESIIRTATGAQRGMSGEDRFIACQLFSKAILAIADRARFPKNVKEVALALDDVKMLAFRMAPGAIGVLSSHDANALSKQISDLQIGQCSYFALQLSLVPEEDGHAVGMVIDKIGHKTYSVGIINSEGWNGERNHPVLAKIASEDDLIKALEDLLTPSVPADRISAGNGKIIQDWLINSIARDQPTVKSIHGTSPVVQTPQKNDDCTIENTFALLAASLCESDYKLAKASCLNALNDIAKGCMRVPGSKLTPADLDALSRRTTSALRGHIVNSKAVRQTDSRNSRGVGSSASPSGHPNRASWESLLARLST